MNSQSITHRKMFRHLCENLDQDLRSPECRAIKKHLEDCTDCITYLNSLKATIALYRRYSIPAPSSSVTKKLRSIPRTRR